MEIWISQICLNAAVLNCNEGRDQIKLDSTHLKLLKVKNSAIGFIIFTVVSCTTLFAMKYILWAMFKWGGSGALGLALIFTCLYVGSFIAITQKWTRHEQYVSQKTLKWIWILGFVQLGVLGGLYHLLPQFFPAPIANFFFA